MAGRIRKQGQTKMVAFRLTTTQLYKLKQVSKTTGKSKTAIMEEALGVYLNMLHLDGII